MVINIHEPAVKMAYKKLKKWNNNSNKRECIKCADKKGLVLLTRSPKTLEVTPYTRCLLCGQLYELTDVEDQNKKVQCQS